VTVSPTHMDITLIICTYNRCDSLAATLESISHSTLPEGIEWEVLVMDNNSSDRTREVVEEFSRRHPDRFRYLLEPRQGKSYALNSGVQDARGDIVVFTDDDVTVDPNWLQNLTSKLHTNEWAGAAGRVLRTWTCPQPPWLSLDRRYEKMGWALVSFDINQEAGELPSAYPPVGANMAFRKAIFSKHGGFRTDLGPRGKEISKPSLKSGSAGSTAGMWEDTEFSQRLFRKGERFRYEPSAVVYHPVIEKRLTKDYFLSWWFSRGRDNMRILPERGPVFGIPRRYVRLGRLSVLIVGKTFGWLFALKSYRRFYYKLLVWELAGSILGLTKSDLKYSGKRDIGQDQVGM